MEKAGAKEKVVAGLAMLLAVAWAAHYLWLTRDRDGFTWMDPYQYYGFARGVLEGTRAWNSFEVASIYPYLLMPTLWLGGGSVPAALATHVWVTLALLGVFFWMARAFGISGGWILMGLFWLGAPLALGLAHELYSETALTLAITAALTATWAAWKRDTWTQAALASGLWGVCLMLKMTAPVFFVGPLLLCGIFALRAGRQSVEFAAALKIAVCYLVALALVALVEVTVFSASWNYWRSFGNTIIPVMELIGPKEFSHWGNLSYYVANVMLYGVPVIGLMMVICLSGIFKSLGSRPRTGPTFDPVALGFLLAWTLVPLVIFTIQPVKEPRHILPCLPALFLLVAIWAQPVTGRWKDLLQIGALGGTALTYGLAMVDGRVIGGGALPYFTRGATGGFQVANAIGKELTPAVLGVPGWGDGQVPGQEIWLRYSLDIGLTGLPPNEALALTWALRPAIVYDLDGVAPSREFTSRLPTERFEDLFVYSSFNQYNARCGLPYRYDWLGTDAGLKEIHPQAVIRPESKPSAPLFDQGVPLPVTRTLFIKRSGNPGGNLAIDFYALPPNSLTARQNYAWRMLERTPPLPANERFTVLASLRRTYVLKKDWDGLRVASANFPELRAPDLRPGRNLYWYGFYPALDAIETSLWAGSPFAAPTPEPGE